MKIDPYATPKRYPAVLGRRKGRERKTLREEIDGRSRAEGSRIPNGKRAARNAIPIPAAKRPWNPARPITHSPIHPPTDTGRKKERPKIPSASARRAGGAEAAM